MGNIFSKAERQIRSTQYIPMYRYLMCHELEQLGTPYVPSRRCVILTLLAPRLYPLNPLLSYSKSRRSTQTASQLNRYSNIHDHRREKTTASSLLLAIDHSQSEDCLLGWVQSPISALIRCLSAGLPFTKQHLTITISSVILGWDGVTDVNMPYNTTPIRPRKEVTGQVQLPCKK